VCAPLHIRHREDGGGNELSNLVTLCEAHHLAHHAGTLNVTRDTSGNVTFTRQASNRYTRTTREVATREELRRRGYDRLQIASIMASTINTIGETDLTEQQWLMMALRAANEHSS